MRPQHVVEAVRAGRDQENGQQRGRRHEQEREPAPEAAAQRHERQHPDAGIAREAPGQVVAQPAASGDRVAHVAQGVHDPHLGRLLRLGQSPAHHPQERHSRGESDDGGRKAPGRRRSDRAPRVARRGAKLEEAQRVVGDEHARAQHRAVLLHQQHQRGHEDRAARSPLAQVEGQQHEERRVPELGVEAEAGIVEDGVGDRAQAAAEHGHATGQVERSGEHDAQHGGSVQHDEAEGQPVGAEGEDERRERDEQVEVVDRGVVPVRVVAQQIARLEQAAAHLDEREEVGVRVLEAVEQESLAERRVENEQEPGRGQGHAGAPARGHLSGSSADRRPTAEGGPRPRRSGVPGPPR